MEELKRQWEVLPLWQKYLIAGGLPLAFAYLLWSFLLTPLNESIKKLEKEREDLKGRIKLLTLQLQPQKLKVLRAQLQRELKAVEEERKKLSQEIGKILTREEVGKTLDFLEESSKKNGVKIEYINWGSIKATTYSLKEEGGEKVVVEGSNGSVRVNLYRGEITLGVSAPFNRIINFLKDLKEELVSYPQGIKFERKGQTERADLRLYYLMWR